MGLIITQKRKMPFCKWMKHKTFFIKRLLLDVRLSHGTTPHCHTMFLLCTRLCLNLEKRMHIIKSSVLWTQGIFHKCCLITMWLYQMHILKEITYVNICYFYLTTNKSHWKKLKVFACFLLMYKIQGENPFLGWWLLYPPTEVLPL